MLSHNSFYDAMYQIERMRRHMFRDFERSFGSSSLNLFDDGYDDDFGFGFAPFRRHSYRHLRNEPELLALREPRFDEIDENTHYYSNYEINNNSHVIKKTIEKEPGKELKTHTEEYDIKPALKDDEAKQLKNSPERGSKRSSEKETRQLKNVPERISKKTQEKTSEKIPRREEKDDNLYYYSKYEINDNGHVWKKTIEKEPGQQLKTHVEEYDVKPALKNSETRQLKNTPERTFKKSPENSSKKSPVVKQLKFEEQQKKGSASKSVSERDD